METVKLKLYFEDGEKTKTKTFNNVRTDLADEVMAQVGKMLADFSSKKLQKTTYIREKELDPAL